MQEDWERRKPGQQWKDPVLSLHGSSHLNFSGVQTPGLGGGNPS